MMTRLAIITSHPIQYNAPLFVELAKYPDLDVKVYYTWGIKGFKGKYDPGFNKVVAWDIPVLEGYAYEFVKNISFKPGSHWFFGIINSDLIRTLNAWNTDAILVYGWNFYSHFKVLRNFKNKKPLYFRGDSHIMIPSVGIKKILKEKLLRWVYKHIDVAFYVGKNNKDYYQRYGLTESQLIFAPHSVDNAHFQISDPLISEKIVKLKNECELFESDIIFLYAGKLEEVKATELLIKAFKNIDKQNYKLLIVGNGSLENKLKNQAKDDSRIKFIPFQNQKSMPLIYQLCDVFVLPSISETWGLSINEVMVGKKAVLVSNTVGCAVDLVHPGINGYIFESGNSDDLEHYLGLMSDKQMLNEMGKQSFMIIQAWDVRVTADIMANTICKHHTI